MKLASWTIAVVTLSGVPAGQLAIVTASTDYSCDGPIAEEVRVGESGTVANVELTADPASIPADGASQSTIAIHVTNSGGVGLASKTVNLTKTGGGALSDTSITTNGSGDGTVTLTSSTTLEIVTITGTCQGVSGQTTVEFVECLPPSISITQPPGYEVHVAQNNPYVLIGGLAADNTGIAHIWVKIDGNWNEAGYADGSWSYSGWQITESGPTLHTIQARAYDYAGNFADVIKDVTVTMVTVKYVDKDALGPPHDGSTWNDAYLTVQAGLDDASSGNDVWVAARTAYNEQITLVNGVGLYGGFSGDEIYREQRDWHSNVTTLDGGGNGSVVTCDDVGESAIIDGFTIENGEAENGGGIKCTDSSPTISHNIITANSADGGAEGYALGGGIYCSGGSPVIVNNIINSNNAEGGMPLGAGIYCDSCPYVRIVNNTITNNTHYPGDGGGIYATKSWLVIANNIIAYNSTGICVAAGDAELVNNCLHNHPGDDYLGIEAGGNDIADDPSLDVDGIHLLTGSHCIDAGDYSLLESMADINGEYRIQDGAVDIGADEFTGCIRYGLTLTAGENAVVTGTAVTITATVYDAVTGTGIPYVTVTFTADHGDLSAGTAETDSGGHAQVTLTGTTPGLTLVTATVESSACEAEVSRSVNLVFFSSTCVWWPMFMHDEGHTGLSPMVDSTATETFSTEYGDHWEKETPTNQCGNEFTPPIFDSSPVVADGLVVVGTWTSSAVGDVRAYEATTGQLIWRAHDCHAMGGVTATPCIDDHKVYLASASGYLYCFDLGDGRQLWKSPLFSSTAVPSCSSPVVHDGVVYAANYEASVYAFDALTGELLEGWPVAAGEYEEADPTTLASPAIATVSDHDYLLIGTNDGNMNRIDLDSNPHTVAHLSLGAAVDSSASVSGGYAYVGCNRTEEYLSNLYRLTVASFAVANEMVLPAEVRTTPALGFGNVYAGCDTGQTLHQNLASNLQQLHYFDAGQYGDYFVGSAALTKTDDDPDSPGILYTGNDNGNLYARSALDVSDTENASAYQTEGCIRSSPAIAYIADSSGNLDRWVFITTQANGGRLLAFKTDR